jgi:hypothetical protein
MIPFFELTWQVPDPKYGCPRTPPHKLLAGICGSWVIKTEDKWLEWAMLQEEYGWEVLLKAAKQCPPDKRWRSDVEARCIALKKQACDEAKELAHKKALAERPVALKADAPQRAKTFSDIMKANGLL